MNHTLARATEPASPAKKFAHRAILVLLVALICAPAGILAWFATSSVPSFGTSYPVVNATTQTNLTDQTSDVQEVLWSQAVVQGADFLYQDTPLNLMAGAPLAQKAIVRIIDTQKVAGQKVNINTMGGFGGPGVQGNGDRIGAEQKIQVGVFDVQIGKFWFGVGFQSNVRDQTVIGGRLDRHIRDGLRAQHAKKRHDDKLMRLIQFAATTAGWRNRMFPPGITSRGGLVTASVLSTSGISAASANLSSNGAMPMALGSEDSGGSQVEKFMTLATHLATKSLATETAYKEANLNAGVRGPENKIFKGNYNEWDGVGIYRWYMRDHGNWGPVGSPLAPRLFLGAALTGANTGSFVVGGGNATAAATLPAPKYTEFFSAAPYTFHDGVNNIAAVTDVTRYLLIINNDGTGYAIYSYKVNDGNKITIFARVADSGTSYNHPIGSLCVEVADGDGVPLGRSLFFGQEMICEGLGKIDGTVNSVGRRTYEERNHQVDFGIGVEAAWGCAVTERSDGVAPNFIIMEHALAIAGAPTVT